MDDAASDPHRRTAKVIVAVLSAAIVAALAVWFYRANAEDQARMATQASVKAATTWPAAEQDALDAVAPGCKEGPDKLDAEARVTLDELESHGIHDESVTTVLQHLRTSLPTSAPVMDCAELLTIYARLREGTPASG